MGAGVAVGGTAVGISVGGDVGSRVGSGEGAAVAGISVEGMAEGVSAGARATGAPVATAGCGVRVAGADWGGVQLTIDRQTASETASLVSIGSWCMVLREGESNCWHRRFGYQYHMCSR
jgi:hypothetical protein